MKSLAFLIALLPFAASALNVDIVENTGNKLVFDVKNYGVGNDLQIKTGIVVHSQADASGFEVSIAWGNYEDTFRHEFWKLVPTGFAGASCELKFAGGVPFWRYTYTR